MLLFIGGFALIAELSSPGIGVGGFISALCFLLYFWSNFLAGTAELLEILLFLAGITVAIFVHEEFEPPHHEAGSRRGRRHRASR